MLDIIYIDEHYSSHFHIRKWYINFTDDAVALKFVIPPLLTTHRVLTCPMHTQIPLGWLLEARMWKRTGLVTLQLHLVHLRVMGSKNASLICRHGWHQGKMKKWHVELAISGPAVSIIRGQFVRSMLVFMTSTQLRRWIRATEEDYKGKKSQKDPTECFIYHLQRLQAILVFGNNRGKWFQKP